VINAAETSGPFRFKLKALSRSGQRRLPTGESAVRVLRSEKPAALVLRLEFQVLRKERPMP
jgi:hypothetical protein